MVYLCNPLPSALRHYADEVVETGSRIGTRFVDAQARPVEGLSGAAGQAMMARNAVQNARDARRRDASTIQLWPSLGLLDPILWTGGKSRAAVVLHDPVPLRRQVGFGKTSKYIAKSSGRAKSPLIISHSRAAYVEATQLLPSYEHLQVRHPVMTASGSAVKADEPLVVVAGQYKPQRDLELLAAIGPLLRSAGVRAEIHGRGWPADIPGWDVSSRFLSEAELDHVLGRAWGVLIPYNLYFQSGIALRALELGTVSVSPRTSFAEDLNGVESALIVDDDSPEGYVSALTAAMNSAGDARQILHKYRTDTDVDWVRLASALD